MFSKVRIFFLSQLQNIFPEPIDSKKVTSKQDDTNKQIAAKTTSRIVIKIVLKKVNIKTL